MSDVPLGDERDPSDPLEIIRREWLATDDLAKSQALLRARRQLKEVYAEIAAQPVESKGTYGVQKSRPDASYHARLKQPKQMQDLLDWAFLKEAGVEQDKLNAAEAAKIKEVGPHLPLEKTSKNLYRNVAFGYSAGGRLGLSDQEERDYDRYYGIAVSQRLREEHPDWTPEQVQEAVDGGATALGGAAGYLLERAAPTLSQFSAEALPLALSGGAGALIRGAGLAANVARAGVAGLTYGALKAPTREERETAAESGENPYGPLARTKRSLTTGLPMAAGAALGGALGPLAGLTASKLGAGKVLAGAAREGVGAYSNMLGFSVAADPKRALEHPGETLATAAELAILGEIAGAPIKKLLGRKTPKAADYEMAEAVRIANAKRRADGARQDAVSAASGDDTLPKWAREQAAAARAKVAGSTNENAVVADSVLEPTTAPTAPPESNLAHSERIRDSLAKELTEAKANKRGTAEIESRQRMLRFAEKAVADARLNVGARNELDHDHVAAREAVAPGAAEAVVDTVREMAADNEAARAVAPVANKSAEGRRLEQESAAEQATKKAEADRALAEVVAVPEAATRSDIDIEPLSRMERVETARIGVDAARLQFKADANAPGGVNPSARLGGAYKRVPLRPLLLWEDNAGKLWVVDGHHRLDLAKRTDTKHVDAQIVREKDGVTVEHARALGAIGNIRDEKGSVADYARFFRNAPGLTRERVEREGLLAGDKGRAGWVLGRDSSDALFNAFTSGTISEAAARSVAEAAPGNHGVHDLLVNRLKEGKVKAENLGGMAQYLAAVSAETPSGAKVEQGVLFAGVGENDRILAESEATAKVAAAHQQDIAKDLQATSGPVRQAERAAQYGTMQPGREQEVKERVGQLQGDRDRWAKWASYPDLVDQAREEAGLPPLRGREDIREARHTGKPMPGAAETPSLFGAKPEAKEPPRSPWEERKREVNSSSGDTPTHYVMPEQGKPFTLFRGLGGGLRQSHESVSFYSHSPEHAEQYSHRLLNRARFDASEGSDIAWDPAAKPAVTEVRVTPRAILDATKGISADVIGRLRKAGVAEDVLDRIGSSKGVHLQELQRDAATFAAMKEIGYDLVAFQDYTNVGIDISFVPLGDVKPVATYNTRMGSFDYGAIVTTPEKIAAQKVTGAEPAEAVAAKVSPREVDIVKLATREGGPLASLTPEAASEAVQVWANERFRAQAKANKTKLKPGDIPGRTAYQLAADRYKAAHGEHEWLALSQGARARAGREVAEELAPHLAALREHMNSTEELAKAGINVAGDGIVYLNSGFIPKGMKDWVHKLVRDYWRGGKNGRDYGFFKALWQPTQDFKKYTMSDIQNEGRWGAIKKIMHWTIGADIEEQPVAFVNGVRDIYMRGQKLTAEAYARTAKLWKENPANEATQMFLVDALHFFRFSNNGHPLTEAAAWSRFNGEVTKLPPKERQYAQNIFRAYRDEGGAAWAHAREAHENPNLHGVTTGYFPRFRELQGPGWKETLRNTMPEFLQGFLDIEQHTMRDVEFDHARLPKELAPFSANMMRRLEESPEGLDFDHNPMRALHRYLGPFLQYTTHVRLARYLDKWLGGEYGPIKLAQEQNIVDAFKRFSAKDTNQTDAIKVGRDFYKLADPPVAGQTEFVLLPVMSHRTVSPIELRVVTETASKVKEGEVAEARTRTGELRFESRRVKRPPSDAATVDNLFDYAAPDVKPQKWEPSGDWASVGDVEIRSGGVRHVESALGAGLAHKDMVSSMERAVKRAIGAKTVTALERVVNKSLKLTSLIQLGFFKHAIALKNVVAGQAIALSMLGPKLFARAHAEWATKDGRARIVRWMHENAMDDPRTTAWVKLGEDKSGLQRFVAGLDTAADKTAFMMRATDTYNRVITGYGAYLGALDVMRDTSFAITAEEATAFSRQGLRPGEYAEAWARQQAQATAVRAGALMSVVDMPEFMQTVPGKLLGQFKRPTLFVARTGMRMVEEAAKHRNLAPLARFLAVGGLVTLLDEMFESDAGSSMGPRLNELGGAVGLPLSRLVPQLADPEAGAAWKFFGNLRLPLPDPYGEGPMLAAVLEMSKAGLAYIKGDEDELAMQYWRQMRLSDKLKDSFIPFHQQAQDFSNVFAPGQWMSDVVPSGDAEKPWAALDPRGRLRYKTTDEMNLRKLMFGAAASSQTRQELISSALTRHQDDSDAARRSLARSEYYDALRQYQTTADAPAHEKALMLEHTQGFRQSDFRREEVMRRLPPWGRMIVGRGTNDQQFDKVYQRFLHFRRESTRQDIIDTFNLAMGQSGYALLSMDRRLLADQMLRQLGPK